MICNSMNESPSSLETCVPHMRSFTSFLFVCSLVQFFFLLSTSSNKFFQPQFSLFRCNVKSMSDVLISFFRRISNFFRAISLFILYTLPMVSPLNIDICSASMISFLSFETYALFIPSDARISSCFSTRFSYFRTQTHGRFLLITKHRYLRRHPERSTFSDASTSEVDSPFSTNPRGTLRLVSLTPSSFDPPSKRGARILSPKGELEEACNQRV